MFDSNRRKQYCQDCIGLMRVAKKLHYFTHGRVGRKRNRILTRDNWVCQLCLLPINPNSKLGEHLFGNVDHIIPVSKAGSSEDSNLQATHSICNSIKSSQEDTLFKDTMRPVLQEIVRSLTIEL